MLEGEANYGASGLMFGGKVFTKEALDTTPEWKSIELLKKRHKKSWVGNCGPSGEHYQFVNENGGLR